MTNVVYKRMSVHRASTDGSSELSIPYGDGVVIHYVNLKILGSRFISMGSNSNRGKIREVRSMSVGQYIERQQMIIAPT
jgi:hypothetical protein